MIIDDIYIYTQIEDDHDCHLVLFFNSTRIMNYLKNLEIEIVGSDSQLSLFTVTCVP